MLVAGVLPAAQAQTTATQTTATLATLYAFGGSDGQDPLGNLVQGNDGNFYGTTYGDLDNQLGTVFRFTPAGVLKTLYSFSGPDGASPFAGMVVGSDGNFYGTTYYGGATYVGETQPGDGTIFRMTPKGVLTTLYSFSGGLDGANPRASLVMGSDGNFYGTTNAGGATAGSTQGSGEGTVFRITLAGVLTTLYSFNGLDGASPVASLVLGSDGNFYGTTGVYFVPKNSNDGTVFQLTPAGVPTTLVTFHGANGFFPATTLVQGSDGNFYGTTAGGGAGQDGTLYEVTVNEAPPAFFTGEVALSSGVYYLAFSNGNDFGYYSYLSDPAYLYHYDLGYEYVFDAADGNSGVYFYDFASSGFFYTSPNFPFPYLYDFNRQSVVYYYPDPNNPGHYNSDGIRYFYVFSTGQITSK